MNILVTGASGFIGSCIVDKLLSEGYEVTCAVRNTAYAGRIFPKAKIISCDFEQDTHPNIWFDRLKGIECVINAVGILYHPKTSITQAIHTETPKAIFDAAVRAGVRKIIHISALGVDKVDVPYAATKKAAEDHLLTLPMQHIILRPSLVVGHGAYGGTALFRGLAGLPFVTPIPGTGEQEFQPIQLDDLVSAISHFVQNDAAKSGIYTAVGPDRVSLRNILGHLRQWLGFPPSFPIYLPMSMIQLASRAGDWIPYSATNSTSYKMMQQHNVATEEETQEFHHTIGFVPKGFEAGLYESPSSLQDQWHARLSFLPTLLRASLGAVWVMTGLFSKNIIDAVLGIVLLTGYKTRFVAGVQVALMGVYLVFATFASPSAWFDPDGALIKYLPMIVATLVLMGMEPER